MGRVQAHDDDTSHLPQADLLVHMSDMEHLSAAGCHPRYVPVSLDWAVYQSKDLSLGCCSSTDCAAAISRQLGQCFTTRESLYCSLVAGARDPLKQRNRSFGR